MADVERDREDGGPNIIETMARFLLGQLKMTDMEEHNRVTLSDYLGLMDEDPKFKDAVYARKNKMLLEQQNGKKTSLYTKEELSKIKKHKRKYASSERAFQPALFDERVREEGTAKQGIIFDSDPEKKLADLHKNQENRFTRNKNILIGKEIQQKRRELRDRIGLPVARGKSEHVNDIFYKFLVRRVVSFDSFGIFCEFDRVITQAPPELDSKIGEVKGVISELLGGAFNHREKFRRFYEFSREYTEKWGE